MCAIIGSVLLIDGDFRSVYLDHGREYFFNDAGLPVFGDWSDLDGQDIIASDAPQSFATCRPMWHETA